MTEQNRNRLPSANAELVRDPDYLSARIREILAEATKFAAEKAPDGRPRSEVFSLRYDLERLVTEIGIFGTGGDDLIAKIRELAPGLHWTRTGDGVHSFAPSGGAAEGAAEVLAIPEHSGGVNGSRAWIGKLDGFAVRIYGPAMAQESDR